MAGFTVTTPAQAKKLMSFRRVNVWILIGFLTLSTIATIITWMTLVIDNKSEFPAFAVSEPVSREEAITWGEKNYDMGPLSVQQKSSLQAAIPAGESYQPFLLVVPLSSQDMPKVGAAVRCEEREGMVIQRSAAPLDHDDLTKAGISEETLRALNLYAKDYYVIVSGVLAGDPLEEGVYPMSVVMSSVALRTLIFH